MVIAIVSKQPDNIYTQFIQSVGLANTAVKVVIFKLLRCHMHESICGL